ncbi:MAG: hypothetical protein ACREDR_19580, partial [Blastocatellia bacterium]
MNCNYAFTAGDRGMRMCPAGRHVMDPGWSDCPYCGGSPGLAPANPAGPTPQAVGGRTPTVAENPGSRGPTMNEQDRLPKMPPPPLPS